MKHQRHICALIFLLGGGILFAQELSKEQRALEQETENLLAEGNEKLFNDEFVEAEADYRKAIAINPKKEVAKYNLGNAYYNKEKNDEAMRRFQQAAAVAENKPERHKAYHNLGNTLMNAKRYEEAVEAYKNALRNNPSDDETRYNLALAKDLLEKNPPQGGDGEDDKKDQQEKQDQNQDQNKDNQNQDGENNDQNQDQNQDQEEKDQGDQKDQNQGDEEGENEKPQQPQDQEQGKGDQQQPQQQQPQQGQMSPQQIKNLLEAMNNEEKKVQDKINVEKQKGAKIKSNKDW